VELWGIDLKGGMELAPWAACFARLAFTPDQASQLFRDAVTKLNERAARMAAEGKRVWEPTPDYVLFASSLRDGYPARAWMAVSASV
jgi:hypothetical protein